MSFWEFANESPFAAFFISASLGGYVAQVLVVAINRPLRFWHMRKHGYPPPHCDADGDFKPAEKEDA